MKSYLARRTELFCLLVLLLSTTAWFGGFSYYLELLTHFRLHYLVLALLCLVVFIWAGRTVWIGVAVLVMAVNLPALLPAYLPADPGSAEATESLRIVSANVHAENDQYVAFISWAIRQRPDVIIVYEVSPIWGKALKPLEAKYPHHVQIPRNDNFGLSVFSRLPLEKQKLLVLGSAGVPTLLIKVTSGKHSLSIMATHPMPPVNDEFFIKRNEQLDAVAAYMARLKGSRMVIGDLNTSQWSPYFTALRGRAGLKNARDGFGILPTWPASLPGLMIPLDHCLVSPDMAVRDIRVGDDIGSDHLPLFVHVAF